MASEATKMAVEGKMHMNPRVFKAADFNYDIRFEL